MSGMAPKDLWLHLEQTFERIILYTNFTPQPTCSNTNFYMYMYFVPGLSVFGSALEVVDVTHHLFLWPIVG